VTASIQVEQESRSYMLHLQLRIERAWAPVMSHLGHDYRVLAQTAGVYGRPRPAARCAARAGCRVGVVELCWMLLADQCDLVGHSYGGTSRCRCEALPAAGCSLTLIEPVAFHLLRRGADEPERLAEIAALASAT